MKLNELNQRLSGALRRIYGRRPIKPPLQTTTTQQPLTKNDAMATNGSGSTDGMPIKTKHRSFLGIRLS